MIDPYNLGIPAVYDYQVRYLRDIKLNRRSTQVGNQCLFATQIGNQCLFATQVGNRCLFATQVGNQCLFATQVGNQCLFGLRFPALKF